VRKHGTTVSRNISRYPTTTTPNPTEQTCSIIPLKITHNLNRQIELTAKTHIHLRWHRRSWQNLRHSAIALTYIPHTVAILFLLLVLEPIHFIAVATTDILYRGATHRSALFATKNSISTQHKISNSTVLIRVNNDQILIFK
jgi:hypothetical protein